MADELKPCPFCGREPIFVDDDTYGHCIISCDCDNDFTASASSGEIKNTDKIIEAWNKRAEEKK